MKPVSSFKMHFFLFMKLPAAFLCGVRLKSMDESKTLVTVKHRWINQNPFKSMYFAVQSMAAEFTTGVMVMFKIKATGKKISMLVTKHEGSFTKKATGRITFTCEDGDKIDAALQKTIATGEGQVVQMKSIGTDKAGDVVSTYTFEWSVRLKKSKS